MHVLIEEIFVVVIMCGRLLDIKTYESYSDPELIVYYIGYDMAIKNYNRRFEVMMEFCLISGTFDVASLP